MARRCSTCSPTPSSRRCCSSARAASSTPCTTSRTCAYYGALRKEIPLTFWAMMIGTLAITGVGIVGRRGFAGFFSKDAIIESAFASGSVPGGDRLLHRRLRGAADQLLQLAAGLPDLLRQAALGRVRAYPARAARRSMSIPTRSMATAPTSPAHAAGRHRRLSSARKPVDDAGAARPAVARRGLRRAALPRRLHRAERRAFLGRQHRLRRASGARDARGAAVGEAAPPPSAC